MEHPDLIDGEGDTWKWVVGGLYKMVGGTGIARSLEHIRHNFGLQTNTVALEECTNPVCSPEAACDCLGDPAYLGLLDELRELHLRKAADYGDGKDPLANLRQSETLGIKPWIGCILRCNDKMQRVRSLIRNGGLANESIEDNLKDMAAYCLLALKFVKEDK